MWEDAKWEKSRYKIVHIYTYIHTYTHIPYIHTYMYTYKNDKYTHMYIYMKITARKYIKLLIVAMTG